MALSSDLTSTPLPFGSLYLMFVTAEDVIAITKSPCLTVSIIRYVLPKPGLASKAMDSFNNFFNYLPSFDKFI